MKARALRRQDGMTLVEVLVTILVITVGTLATLGTYAHFSSAARKARERAVLTSLAQREIEQLKPIDYAQLGLTSAPTAQAVAEAPLTGAAASEPGVVGGVVRPGGDAFSVQGATGRIYRYVTWRNEPCGQLSVKVQTDVAGLLGQTTAIVSAALPNLCPGSNQTKRVTVVVVPADAQGATAAPLRLSTIAESPSSVAPGIVNDATLAVKKVVAATTGAVTPPAAAVLTQTLQLYDTRCSIASRQSPSDHSTRDTSQASFTCSPSGPAPTLMGLAAIPGATTDALKDFSTDITRAAAGGLDLVRDSLAGSCTDATAMVYTNGQAATRMQSLHTWASTLPAAAVETPVSGGRASLTLWTSTATGVDGPGRLCVSVRRASTGEVIGSSDFSLASWPGKPTQLVTAFDLANTTLAAGERLLLTVRVPADSGSDLRLLYDHPAYPSALSITAVSGKELK